MGIFDFLHKNKKSNLPQNDLVKFIASNLKNPTDENILKVVNKMAEPDKDLEHLNAAGELPWGWHNYSKDFREKIQSEYSLKLHQWLDAKKKSPTVEHFALTEFVEFLEKTEKLCKDKSECFEFWYYEVLTTRNYLQERKNELQHLSENLDKLEAEYQEKSKELINLDSKIINLLKENDGILQSDFVKLFNPLIQNEVKDFLYHYDKKQKLQRTKSGRSYILHLK